jgi:hypothetical protein
MRDANDIVRDRQLAIRRELDRRGIALKAVSFDSGIPYPTLLSYFPADKTPATMSAAALYALCGAIPEDILSLMVPDGWSILRTPAALNHDEVADAMTDYFAAKQRAHRSDSECGEAIGPNEDNILRGKFAVIKAVAA